MTSRSSFSQEVFHAECLGGVFKDSVPNTSDTWVVLRISVLLFKEEIVYVNIGYV